MGRTGVLIAFAVIGYFVGVAAYYIGKHVWPWLLEVLPFLAQGLSQIAGIIGAIVTVVLVVVWSYTTKSS